MRVVKEAEERKNEILDAMIDRMMERQLEKAKEIVARKDVPVLQRLTMMILALNVSGGNLGQELLDHVHKPQNALMHQKIEKSLLSGINPIITDLIKEGITQGICQTDYPEEVAEMTFLYANTVFDDLMEHSEEERRRKIAAFAYNLERLLNMERDSMKEAIALLFKDKRR